MPRTVRITTKFELDMLDVFCGKLLADKIREHFNAGRKVERVDSLYNDPGLDYTKILVEGEEVLHINGY